jgi:hypothetical protein
MRFPALTFLCLLVLLVPVTGQAQPAQPPLAPVFSPDDVTRIDIWLPADSLDLLLMLGSQRIDTQFRAGVTIRNTMLSDSLAEVGIRMRGNTSRNAKKVSFRLSFNRFDQGRLYHGLETLNLNGEHNDPTISRARLSWQLARDAGVPAPRAAHAELYINNVYRGLYVMVEPIDDRFVEARFGNRDGNLYKCLWPAALTPRGDRHPDQYKFSVDGRQAYELKTNKEEDDYTDLAALIDMLDRSPSAGAIESMVNVNGFLKALAFTVLAGSWDDYWYNQNNYYLYRNTETGLFEFLLYDFDNTFGISWSDTDWSRRNVYTWGSQDARPLADRILAVPSFRARYTFYLHQMLEGAFDPGRVEEIAHTIRLQVADAALRDTYRTLDYRFTIQEFHQGFQEFARAHVREGLVSFLRKRHSSALAQLHEVSTPPLISYARHAPAMPVSQGTFAIRAHVEGPSAISSVSARVWFGSNPGITIPLAHEGGGTYGGETVVPEGTPALRYEIVAIDGRGLSSVSPRREADVVPDLPRLRINEFMASNGSTIADPFGEYDDWIEIFNAGNVPVNLGGIFLTDNLNRPAKFAFPDTTLAPGGFVLIWADNTPEQGHWHADFALSASGEQLGIFQRVGDELFVPVDTLSFGPQTRDVSMGRQVDGGAPWVFFERPTPGRSNMVSLRGTGKPVLNYVQLYPVSPNPSAGLARVTYTAPAGGRASLAVFDMLGRAIMEVDVSPLTSGVNEALLDVSALSGGVYLLRLDTAAGRASQSFTVVR